MLARCDCLQRTGSLSPNQDAIEDALVCGRCHSFLFFCFLSRGRRGEVGFFMETLDSKTVPDPSLLAGKVEKGFQFILQDPRTSVRMTVSV